MTIPRSQIFYVAVGLLLSLSAVNQAVPEEPMAEASYDYPTEARRVPLKNQIFSTLTFEQARRGVPEVKLLSKKEEKVEYIGDNKDLIDPLSGTPVTREEPDEMWSL